MKTSEQVWGIPEADATPDEAFELGRVAGYDEAMREVAQKTAEDKPGTATREAANFFGVTGCLVLLVALGGSLERLGQRPGQLFWVALSAFLVSFGFGLYAWGAQSASRHTAKGEDTER